MPASNKTDLLRQIPSVDEILRSPDLGELLQREGRAAAGDAVRVVLERLRREIQSGTLNEQRIPIALDGIPEAIERELRCSLSTSLRAVINCTGVILHTNLGRAPISAAALEHLTEIAGGYCNLEFDLETGERGRRDVHVQRLLERLLQRYRNSSDTIHSIVVNNCAAAVLLALNTLAEGGDVVVSRGELVEIGGSFRVPDVMAKSGARLREVGTTNRTRLSDYENAITENTRLLLRVHRSNFAMVGFTEQPSAEELVSLGRRRGIPVMEDLGNGLLLELATVGVHGEHGLRESVAAGVDVVCVSGDKLLGGPQAGIIAGNKELIARMRSNPLFRALRVDKLTYAALEATFLAYIREDYRGIPALHMIYAPAEEIRARADAFVERVALPEPSKAEVIDGESVIGGGTAPNATLPTALVVIRSSRFSPEELQTRLRAQSPAVIGRIEEERLVLDLRTVFPEQEEQLRNAIERTLGS